MYYMDSHNFSKPQWTTSGLLGLLRSSLPAADRKRALAQSWDACPPPEPLSTRDLAEVAGEWRDRSSEGDTGAESVAQALELVAMHRSAGKQKRIQEMGKRLSELMRLP
jgi:hypothetical protein